jgi:hypothetical protein
MSKSVRSNFSDDSFDKIFDIDKIAKSITKSIDKNKYLKYVLIFLFIFALLSGLFAIYLNLNNQEDELE